MPTRTRLAVPFLLVLIMALAACAEVSPAFGQYFQGRTLVVSVVNAEFIPELIYAIDGQQGGLDYMRIAPSEPGLELVILHLKVQNHTATSAIINVDKQGAELRDFNSLKYFPIEVNERVKRLDSPPGKESWSADVLERSARVLELQEDGTFAPSRGFISGPFELQKGTGLDGWMVFEAPPGTKFRTFRWRAGDSLTISF